MSCLCEAGRQEHDPRCKQRDTPLPTIYSLRAQLAEVQAQGAVLRSALEQIDDYATDDDVLKADIHAVAMAALTPDAGRALLDWVKLAGEALQAAQHDSVDCCASCGSSFQEKHRIDCKLREALETKP